MIGKDFESLCIEQMNYEKTDGRGMLSRYGTQSVRMHGEVHELKSLPDFEGVVEMGHQFIFDAKVCSQASFPLMKYRERKANSRRQLRHMYDRSTFRVPCFFLIHFNSRTLKTRNDPEFTTAIPVAYWYPLWEQFESGEIKSISREQAREYGVRVRWTRRPGGTKRRPDILGAVYDVREKLAEHASARQQGPVIRCSTT